MEGPQRLGYLGIKEAITHNVQLMLTTEWEQAVADSGAEAVGQGQRATSWRGRYSTEENGGRDLACVGCLSGDWIVQLVGGWAEPARCWEA